MKDKIIQYLHGVQCEWFPVEWDSYFVEWLAAEIECYDISGIKMRYFFEGKECNIQYVQNVDGKNVTFTHFSHYGTLDRCKTLLLNAVRSAIESKDPAGHPRDYKVYISVSGAIKIVSFPKGGAWETVVWQNGEFK